MPSHRTALFERSFAPNAFRLYNNIGHEMRSAKSMTSFKHNLKKQLLKEQDRKRKRSSKRDQDIDGLCKVAPNQRFKEKRPVQLMQGDDPPVQKNFTSIIRTFQLLGTKQTSFQNHPLKTVI
nr:unnamed protein product [Callosobruchus analis]